MESWMSISQGSQRDGKMFGKCSPFLQRNSTGGQFFVLERKKTPPPLVIWQKQAHARPTLEKEKARVVGGGGDSGGGGGRGLLIQSLYFHLPCTHTFTHSTHSMPTHLLNIAHRFTNRDQSEYLCHGCSILQMCYFMIQNVQKFKIRPVTTLLTH